MERNFKSMSLYVETEERLLRQLRQLGYGDTDLLPPDKLFQLDQLHYGGTDAVQRAIDDCNLTPKSNVLEVGSGLAGPARYIAQKAGCTVTALELQPELHQAAERLTNRCELSNLVVHRQGDILTDAIDNQAFDAVVSWLVFLHIADRQRLFESCFTRLRPGGLLFLEDYYQVQPFSKNELQDLTVKVQCARIPTIDEYQKDITDAGFEIVNVTDMTSQWTDFVNGRFEGFVDRKSTYTDIHGADDYKLMHDFIDTVARLFSAGNLGGIRLVAKAVS